MNFLPIAERELRVAARRPGTYWLRFGCGLFLAVVWFAVMGAGRSQGGLYAVNRSIFQWMATFAFIMGSFAGLALTADCLSREKREGTLGLLFLTDLRGFDIVLGKLSAQAIHVVYALLAVTPILALPLLVGGIGGREFTAVAVALLDGLLFFMALGLIVSGYTQDSRVALSGALILALGVTVGLPLFYLANSSAGGPPREDGVLGICCLWPSPAYTLAKALFNPGSVLFWNSCGVIVLLAAVFLLITCRVLPRRWALSESASIRTGYWARQRRRQRYGDGSWREKWRAKTLPKNPAFWLATRDRPVSSSLFSVLTLLLPLWLLCWYLCGLTAARGLPPEKYFILCFLSALVFHVLAKIAIAAEVSNRLCADRHSGAGELLVVTPLTRWEVVEGQHRGARFLFGKSLILLALLNALLMLLVENNANGLHFNPTDQGIFSTLFLGGAIALATDFEALSWAGMRAAWSGSGHLRATMLALATVMGPPWLALFLFVFGRFGAPIAQSMVEVFFLIWMVSGIGWSVLVAYWSRQKLKRGCDSRAVQPWP